MSGFSAIGIDASTPTGRRPTSQNAGRNAS
jgi:hypothetical protein